MKKNINSVIPMTIAVTLCFFIFGYFEAAKGATLSGVMGQHGLGYQTGGTLVSISYIGFLSASILAGMLVDKIGKKRILVLAVCILFIGALGYAIMQNVFLLSLSILFLGFGSGTIELSGNFVIVDIHKENKRGMYLNIIAGVYCIGAILAPILAGKLLEMELSWNIVYLFSLVVLAVILVYLARAKYPTKTYGSENKFTKDAMLQVIKNKNLVAFYFLVVFYVSAEIGVSSWLSKFLVDCKNIDFATASMYLSVFYLLIAVGRFAGSVIVDKIGYYTSIIGGLLISMVLVILGVLLPPNYSFLIVLSGLFFSVVLPTVIALVAEKCKTNMGMTLGILFAFVGLGGMLGGWIIGVVTEWLGFEIGFSVVALACFAGLVLACSQMLQDKKSKRLEENN